MRPISADNRVVGAEGNRRDALGFDSSQNGCGYQVQLENSVTVQHCTRLEHRAG